MVMGVTMITMHIYIYEIIKEINHLIKECQKRKEEK